MHAHPAEIALQWLRQAESDITGAEAMVDIEHYDLACFLSQQVAEKALKAMLVWLDGDKPRTHVIADLLRAARRHPNTISNDDLRDIETLDQYYLATRYPDALGGALPSNSFRRPQGVHALELAREALTVARRIIPEAESA